MADTAQKTIVIALDNCIETNNLPDTKYRVAIKYGISHPTLLNWGKQAPEVVQTLFYIAKENPKTDILKALKQWQKPPFVLAFLRDFMNDYKVNFLDLVKEV